MIKNITKMNQLDGVYENGGQDNLNIEWSVGRYPRIKLGTRKLVSKSVIRGIDGRQTVMRTQ